MVSCSLCPLTATGPGLLHFIRVVASAETHSFDLWPLRTLHGDSLQEGSQAELEHDRTLNLAVCAVMGPSPGRYTYTSSKASQ